MEELVSYSNDIAKANLGFIKMLGIPIYEIPLADPITSSELYKLQQFITRNADIKQNYQMQYV